MRHPLAVTAVVSLLLSATRLVPAPFDFVILGVAAVVLYQFVRTLAGLGAARVATTLLVASLAPTLSAADALDQRALSMLSTLSLPWWLPLLAGGVAVTRHDAAAHRAWPLLAVWWGVTALVATAAPAPWAALSTPVETAPAAALAGLAVARLAGAAAGVANRRAILVASLTATSVWQAWLVLGTGRPARVLVPMLVAALTVATADVLAQADASREARDGIGAALVVAMLALGLAPGAHTRLEQNLVASARHMPTAALHGADVPSSIAAP